MTSSSRTPTPPRRTGPDAIERAAKVLMDLPTGGRVGEIAERVQMPKATVHRILASLSRAGLAVQDSVTRAYRLGPLAVSLGVSAIGSPDLRSRALPLMHELWRATDETSTLSLRVGSERVYVAQVESTQDVRMTIEIGRRHPLHAGGSGKAILAFLDARDIDKYLGELTLMTAADRAKLVDDLETIRRLGYAVGRGERDPSAAAVAAPIMDLGGMPVASISICGPVVRFDDDDRILELGALVSEAAQTLSRPDES